jgi:hypothetical protein
MNTVQAHTFLVGATGAGCAVLLVLALAVLEAERRDAARRGGYALRVWARDASVVAAASLGLACVLVAWASVAV